jgi:hypothetical protein
MNSHNADFVAFRCMREKQNATRSVLTRKADCGLSLQARAIHPAGLEADIQATPNRAWRCAAAWL